MSNGTPSPGKDEIFDRTARLVMTSVNDGSVHLLSPPTKSSPVSPHKIALLHISSSPSPPPRSLLFVVFVLPF